MSDSGQLHSLPADGVELTRLLENLVDLVRLLAEATTLEELLEVAGEHVLSGLGSASVSLSRLEPGTTTLRTLINVGDLGPAEQRWPKDETYNLQNLPRLREIMSDRQTWRQMWTVTVNDTHAEAAELALLAELGKQAATSAALVVNNALWGELVRHLRSGRGVPRSRRLRLPRGVSGDRGERSGQGGADPVSGASGL